MKNVLAVAILLQDAQSATPAIPGSGGVMTCPANHTMKLDGTLCLENFGRSNCDVGPEGCGPNHTW